MIEATTTEHSGTINELAREGKIRPVAFTAPDGVRREANSVWAASDWLKTNGYYDGKPRPPVAWHF